MLKHKIVLTGLFSLTLFFAWDEAFAVRCAGSITVAPTTTQNLCQGSTAATLTASIIPTGGGAPGDIIYTWYSNSTNSTVGGTVVQTASVKTNSNGGTNTLIIPTSSNGTLYYYCVVTNVNGTGCVGVTHTTATVRVNVTSPSAPPNVDGVRCGTGTVLISATPGVGETIDWYAAATGGTALLTGSVSYTTPTIATTTIYYAAARNTTTGCVSVTRTPVSAIVYPIPVAPVGTGSSSCGTGTVSISATPGPGETIDWYAAAIGGTALATGSLSFITPIIASTTVYYAEARNPTCGAVSPARTAVTATINPVPTLGSVAQAIAVCSGLSATINLTGLLASTAQTISYNINGGGTVTASITSSGGGTGSFSVPVTIANNGQSLTVTRVSINATNCFIDVSSPISLQVNDLPVVTSQPGTSDQQVCKDSPAIPISVSASAGSGTITTYRWYSNTISSNVGGTLVATNTTAAGTDTYNPVTSANGILYYYAVITNSNNCIVTSNASGAVDVSGGSVPVITTQPSTGIQNICLNGVATALTIVSNGTNYQWYSSPNSDGSTATLISGAVTNTYTPLTTSAGTLYYFCSVSNNNCSVISDVSGAITVYPTSVAGTISGATAVCEGINNTLLSLSGHTGTIQWQSSPDNVTFSDIIGETATTHTATNLAATTYYKAIVTSGVCSPAVATSVVISVDPASVSGTITGTTTVCAGTNSTVLTLSGNTGSVQWQSSPDNITFSDIPGATLTTYTAVNLSATTYYHAVVTSGACLSATTASATMTVSAASIAGTISGAASVCSPTNSTLLTLSGNTGTVQWQSSSDDVTFNDIIGATASSYTAIDVAATTYYRAVVSSAPCSPVNTASVSIIVNPGSVAGTISGATSVCSVTNSTQLTLSGNTGTVQWQSSADNFTFNDIPGATGSTYTAVNLIATTYFRVAVTNGLCATLFTPTVSIIVSPTGVTVWTGNLDSDWSDPFNWTCGLPGVAKDAIIPAGLIRYPIMGAILGQVKNLTIENGASITLAGGTLFFVYGNWTNNNTSVSTFASDFSEVIFIGGGTQTINGPSDFYYLTIDSSNGPITVELNGNAGLSGVLTMTSGAILNTNDNLTILSRGFTTDLDGAIGPVPASSSINGNVTVQRYMDPIGNTFRYLASPVSSALPPAAWGSGIYEYINISGSGSWSKHPTTTPLELGIGYAVGLNMNSAITWSVTGPIEYGSHTWTFNVKGWHLLGNPFPSAIRWFNSGGVAWIRNNISSTIGVTDNSITGGYPEYIRYWGYNSAIPGDPGTGAIENGIVAMGQAFWVYVGEGGGSLTVFEQAKENNILGEFYRKKPNIDFDQLKITLDDGKFADVAYLKLNARATDDYEFEYDLKKLWNQENMNLFMVDEAKNELVINTIDKITEDKKIPIGIDVKEAGTFTLSFSGVQNFSNGNRLFLIDLLERIVVPLSEGKYTFQINQSAGTIKDRFYLSLDNVLPERNLAEMLQAFPNPVKDKLTIRIPTDNTVYLKMMDNQGKEILSEQFKRSLEIDMHDYPQGMYVLRFVTEEGVVIRKIIR